LKFQATVEKTDKKFYVLLFAAPGIYREAQKVSQYQVIKKSFKSY